MIAVLTGIAIPCCSPRDVNEFEVVVVGLVAIHDELSSVVSLGRVIAGFQVRGL